MWLNVRPEVARTHLCQKFMANHYLSWNISNQSWVCLNQLFGLIQTIEFDVNFVNQLYFIALLNLLLRLEVVLF
jgi:hypothetical protein